MKEEEERKKQLVVSALEWIAAAACCFCSHFCFVFGWRRDGPKGRRGKGFFVAIASFPRKRGRGREDFGASDPEKSFFPVLLWGERDILEGPSCGPLTTKPQGRLVKG